MVALLIGLVIGCMVGLMVASVFQASGRISQQEDYRAAYKSERPEP